MEYVKGCRFDSPVQTVACHDTQRIEGTHAENQLSLMVVSQVITWGGTLSRRELANGSYAVRIRKSVHNGAMRKHIPVDPLREQGILLKGLGDMTKHLRLLHDWICDCLFPIFAHVFIENASKYCRRGLVPDWSATHNSRKWLCLQELRSVSVACRLLVEQQHILGVLREIVRRGGNITGVAGGERRSGLQWGNEWPSPA